MIIDDVIDGLVLRIASEPVKSKKGDYLFRGLELSEFESGKRIYAMFPAPLVSQDRTDLYEFPLLAWEKAHVRLVNFAVNNTLADGSLVINAAPESQITLEPLRLISVTEAMEASRCLVSADLGLRIRDSDPHWMAKGSMAHSMFQDLIQGAVDGRAPEFDRCYKSTITDLSNALAGSSVSFNDESLKSEARIHYRNIRQWIDSNVETGSTCYTEEDMASCLWGFKGRADAIIVNGQRRHIVELKSGRYKDQGHLAQAMVYSLIAEKGASRDTPLAEVLYSLTGAALKSLLPAPELIAKALLGRNRLVFLNRLHATSPTPGPLSFHETDLCRSSQRCFNKRECYRFTNYGASCFTISHNPEIKGYYDYWFKLLSIDIWEMMGDLANVFHKGRLEQRLNSGEACIVEPVQDSAAGPSESSRGYAFRALAPVEIGPGESVIIHSGDACSQDSIWGRIRGLSNSDIVITANMSGSDAGLIRASLQDGRPLFMERLPFIRNRELARQSLCRFITKAGEDLISAIITDAEYGWTEQAITMETDSTTSSRNPDSDADLMEMEELGFSEGLDQALNPYQANAILRALDSDPYHLIQGPPGSGKTRVLSRLIIKLLENNERILLTCPTNVALDRVLSSLLDLGVGNFIRTGFRSSCSDFLLDRLRPKRKYPVFIDDLAKKLGKVSKISEYIKNCPLVAATCHQVMSNPLFAFQRFDRALIDEAGQLDEPSTLAAISLGNRFILCGDHQQLSPIVRSRESSKGPPETWGLDRSLFERLLLRGPSLAVSKLRIQYRMNDGIQDIVSRVFYSGMLKAAEEVANRKLSIEGDNLDMGGLGDVLDPDRPVIFVDTPSKGTGKTSPEEAQVASIITGELIRRGVGPESIGIITPYRAQQALIREYLTRIGFPTPGLIVNTVDRFQGGEREVIILSLSRSDNVTSFLADRKRLNVSLSRARSKLILIGRRSNLITHDLFKDILQDTHSASLCREYPDGRE